MKKRVLSMLLVSALAIMSISGCGKSEQVKPEQEETKEEVQEEVQEVEEAAVIDIFQNKSEIAEQLQDAVNLYMKEHPNVKINLETVQGNDYNATLKAKMLNDDQPEIMALSSSAIVQEYQEYLEDLSDQPWVDHIVDAAKSDVEIDGKILGLPIALEGYGIVYNKEIFETAGIDVSTLTSYEAMDEAFAALQAKIDAGELKDKYPVLEAVWEFPGKETWILALHGLNVALANDYESANALMKEKEIEFKYAEELKALYELETKYTSAKDNLALLNAVDYATQVGGGLGIERVAVIQQGNWVGSELRNISEDFAEKIDMLPVPLKGINEDSIYVGVAINWCINKNSSDINKQAAKDFMNWLYQSEEGKKIVTEEFGFISALDNYEGYELSDPLSKRVSQYIQEGQVKPWVQGGFPQGYEAQAAADLQAYLSGDYSWDECINKLKEDFAALRQ